jgi:hypothetical protein
VAVVAVMSLGINMALYIPKTNIIPFTHKSGNVTQLAATVVQKYARVMITSVHKGNIMTAIKVFLSPFCTINLRFTTIIFNMLHSVLFHVVKQLPLLLSQLLIQCHYQVVAMKVCEEEFPIILT